ncbi:MAG: DUF559 domain-containing protein [Rhizobiales bacterium]|nr:DUF559 domain-containing protein [Hyphomicrobiales bacterium]
MTVRPRRQTTRARFLRRAETPAEERLWSRLRDRRLAGFKFVRQEPIGSFVVDFLCREARLIVEVDGATHSTDVELAYDHHRTTELVELKFRLLRVTNEDVYHRIDDVLETILAYLEMRT